MIIAVSKIPIGVKQILQNSNRINYMAKRILLDTENHGSIDVIQHHGKYAIILFYYAVEELGKALKLKDEMDDAKTGKKSHIDVTKWFKEHDIKLERAQSEFPKLKIPAYNEEKINDSTIRFHLDEESEVVKGFQERSDFFLVSYDEENKSWINDLSSHIEEDEIIKKINILREIVNDWLDNLEDSFEKSVREFNNK